MNGPAYIPVSAPKLWGNEIDHIARALDAGWVSGMGEPVSRFEQAFAAFIGVPHGVAVSSGTCALQIALRAVGTQPGDEVIVPDFSIASPAFAAVACGAAVVPVDADASWNIDPGKVEAAISPRTRAIVVVHTYGRPAGIECLCEIARRRGIALIEDAAECLGGRVGSSGDAACYSFFANKLITTGEGGMMVTKDAAIAGRARRLRHMSYGAAEETHFLHGEVGFSFRLSSIAAAMGLAQLEHIEEALASKIAIGHAYRRALEGADGIAMAPDHPAHTYWAVGVLVDGDRDSWQRQLHERGIGTRRFFEPLHRQPALAPHLRLVGEFPRSIELGRRGFYLPSWPGMPNWIVDRVAAELRACRPGISL